MASYEEEINRYHNRTHKCSDCNHKFDMKKEKKCPRCRSKEIIKNKK